MELERFELVLGPLFLFGWSGRSKGVKISFGKIFSQSSCRLNVVWGLFFKNNVLIFGPLPPLFLFLFLLDVFDCWWSMAYNNCWSVEATHWAQTAKSGMSATYLIIVIFFTLTQFLENKIYTQKTPIFRVKSVNNATFSRKICRKCQFFALNL